MTANATPATMYAPFVALDSARDAEPVHGASLCWQATARVKSARNLTLGKNATSSQSLTRSFPSALDRVRPNRGDSEARAD